MTKKLPFDFITLTLMRLKGVISDKTVAVYIFFISQFHLMLAESI